MLYTNVSHTKMFYTDVLYNKCSKAHCTYKYITHTNGTHKCFPQMYSTQMLYTNVASTNVGHTNVQKRTAQNCTQLYNAQYATEQNCTKRHRDCTHYTLFAKESNNQTQSLNPIKIFTSETFIFTTGSPLHSAEHHRFIHSSSLLHQYVFTAPERPRIE